jgi:hypothetical protein
LLVSRRFGLASSRTICRTMQKNGTSNEVTNRGIACHAEISGSPDTSLLKR